MPNNQLILAPMRGITVRSFRAVFGRTLLSLGFTAAVAPFIPANPGIRISPKLLADIREREPLPLIPQVIGKHPEALRTLLHAFKDLGYTRADLNAGCPFPMIRAKQRGSGLLRTPDVLERMLEVGCEEMREGNFSLKTRLGVERTDELIAIMPRINRYPLASLTVHARTAKQMYEGVVDLERFKEIAAASTNPIIYNGDVELDQRDTAPTASLMVGRGALHALATLPDIDILLADYLALSCNELCGANPVLGRLKELLSYFTCNPRFSRLWPSIKICRSVDELKMVLGL